MIINHSEQNDSRQSRRYRYFLRMLITDVLPTLLLLLVMALGMSMVARYAESSHSRPAFAKIQTAQQFSE
jgi:hypothetical protein